MGCGASLPQEANKAPAAVPQPQPKPAGAPKAAAKADAPKTTAGYPSEAAATTPLAVSEQPQSKPIAEPGPATKEVVVEPEPAPRIPAKPCLHAYAFAGRAELARLIAAVGGLDIDEQTEVEETIHFGSPGSLPCLTHESLKIAQSFAIESYIASIAPGFKDLTPRQRATDAMFCKIKEDMIAVCIAQVSTMIADESGKASAAGNIGELGDKWFPVIEGMLPTTGFVNGFDFPTAADLAVLNVARGFMPFGVAYMMASYDVPAKFPKFAAHVERVAAHPTVKEFLSRSNTMDADPMDLRAGLQTGETKQMAATPQAKEEVEAASSAAREEAGPQSSPAAQADGAGEAATLQAKEEVEAASSAAREEAGPQSSPAAEAEGAGEAATLQAKEEVEAASSATREEAGPQSSLAAKAEGAGEQPEAKV